MKSRVIVLFILGFIICQPVYSQWKQINSGTLKNLVKGCFVNASTGYVISKDGLILKTTDQGNSWNQAGAIPDTFSYIGASGPDTLYAAGSSLYRSTDAGLSWVYISTFNCTWADSCLVTDMLFFNSRNGFAVYPHRTYCENPIGGPGHWESYHVLQTTDFGISWQYNSWDVDHTSRFQRINDSIAYVTAISPYVVYHCSPYWWNSSQKTTNGGLTWGPTKQPDQGQSLYSYFSADSGYFMVPDASSITSMYKTTDGGQTLNSFPVNITNAGFKQMKFISEPEGYILGIKNILLTKSSGLAWAFDYSGINDLNYLFDGPAGFLFALGKNGKILKKQTGNSNVDSTYQIDLSNYSLDFGQLPVNCAMTEILSVANNGNTMLPLTLSTNSPFTISSDQINFVSSLSFTLQPSQSKTIQVRFKPQSVQQYSDTLVITAPGLNTVKVPESGQGINGLCGDIMRDTILCGDTVNIGMPVTIYSNATVTICPGTYLKFLNHSAITVNGGLRAMGDSAANIQFASGSAGKDWMGIICNVSGNTDTLVFNYCRFTGVCDNGVIYSAQRIISVDHCSFGNENSSGGPYGIRAEANSTLLIKNSRVFNYNSAIMCHGNADITGNELFNNATAVDFNSSGQFNIEGNLIHNNTAISISGANKASIRKNKIFSNAAAIYYTALNSGVRIENNEIYNNSSLYWAGVNCILGPEPSYIIQNLVYNNTADQWNGGGINLSGNSSGDSIVQAYVCGNTICNNRIGAGMTGYDLYANGSLSGRKLQFTDNIIYNKVSPNSSVAYGGNTPYFSYNCINQQGIPGDSNIVGDPLFISPTVVSGADTSAFTADWSLRVESPCINAGDSLPPSLQLPFDFAGRPRVSGHMVDIGAYEYQKPGSIDDEHEMYKVSVYPNPARETLNVLVNGPGKSEIIIYDLTGRQVIRQDLNRKTCINTRLMARGLYFYEVRNSQGLLKEGKIIIQ